VPFRTSDSARKDWQEIGKPFGDGLTVIRGRSRDCGHREALAEVAGFRGRLLRPHQNQRVRFSDVAESPTAVLAAE